MEDLEVKVEAARSEYELSVCTYAAHIDRMNAKFRAMLAERKPQELSPQEFRGWKPEYKAAFDGRCSRKGKESTGPPEALPRRSRMLGEAQLRAAGPPMRREAPLGGAEPHMAASLPALELCSSMSGKARPSGAKRHISFLFFKGSLIKYNSNQTRTTENISASAEAKRKLMPESVGDSCGKADGTRWRELQAGSELRSNPDI